MSKSELTELKSGSLELFDFGDYEGAGSENIRADDFAPPWIVVLQANTPVVVKPSNAGGLPGAKAGMLWNQVSNKMWDGEKGIGLLPVSTDVKFIEYYPKEDDGSGGGFVGVRTPEDEVVVKLRAKHGKFGKLPWYKLEKDGHEEPTELIETKTIMGYIIEDWDDLSTLRRALVSFKSTGIKNFNKFVSTYDEIKYRSAKPPHNYVNPAMWQHRYCLTSQFVSRGNQNWFIPKVDLLTPTDSLKSYVPKNTQLFEFGAKMYESIKRGEITVEYEKTENESAAIAPDEVF